MSTPLQAKWARLLEDARVWPRRIAWASILVSLVLLAVLAAYYVETGNRALILAIVLIAMSIPVDLVVLKAILEGTLYTNALETARILEEAGAGAYRSMPVFNGVLVAARVEDGQLHAILKPNTIEAAYIIDPATAPARGRIKPTITTGEKQPKKDNKCSTATYKGRIEATTLDPSTGAPVKVEGTGVYAY
ncbi:MAG: hypothetical protein GSR78_03935, partial [Desulfurococcales archaeon]|nr:hypothetical protein [Desulfurococcales archaeon]